jgi:hypothetical protein
MKRLLSAFALPTLIKSPCRRHSWSAAAVFAIALAPLGAPGEAVAQAKLEVYVGVGGLAPSNQAVADSVADVRRLISTYSRFHVTNHPSTANITLEINGRSEERGTGRKTVTANMWHWMSSEAVSLVGVARTWRGAAAEITDRVNGWAQAVEPPHPGPSGGDIAKAIILGLAEGLAASNRPVPSITPTTKLMLFGGPDHKTYLGCLNCSKFASDSVDNNFGTHGNKFSSESIFNQFGQYGSKFSTYSPCNAYASDPPVIVDENGDYYGRLTVNSVSADRTQDPQLRAWIAGVCAGR